MTTPPTTPPTTTPTTPPTTTAGTQGTTHAATPVAHYLAPGWFTRRVFNPVIGWLTRRGLSVRGSAVLEVVGRRSGVVRTAVVNPLSVDGAVYLVAPRGNTEWVRNVRAAGAATLLQRRRRTTYTVVEVGTAEAVPVLRHYLVKWSAETGTFFDGLTASSTDHEIAAAAQRHPVLRLN
ncbi:MAG TPA: nitroreductase family deazaflavin-dependent oxidoreductase [Ilumatobacteraceae bacterium]|nr:nitroreductase family deazaflavin-dependent oxidoreductase [Ilumatobacteraceae bacterium]